MFGAISPGKTLGGVVPCYSLMIVAAIGAALFLCFKEEKRRGLPKDTIIDLALWIIPAGIVGARLYYVIFSWEYFASNPISILYVWEGGIAIYGAIIAGAITCLCFARSRKLSPGILIDVIMPGLALAQAIGRWGNYFNMEAYGAEITVPWLQFFPAGVLIPHGDGYMWHLATFFYESLWDLGVFLLLYRLRGRTHRAGDLGLWYVLLYGPGRAIIEGLRMDSLVAGNGLRVSQWLSIFACAAVCLLLFLRSRPWQKESLPYWLVFGSCLFCTASLLIPQGAFTLWLILAAWLCGLGVMGCRRRFGLKMLPTLALMTLPLWAAVWFLSGRILNSVFYQSFLSALQVLVFPAAGAVLYETKEVSPCEI